MAECSLLHDFGDILGAIVHEAFELFHNWLEPEIHWKSQHNFNRFSLLPPTNLPGFIPNSCFFTAVYVRFLFRMVFRSLALKRLISGIAGARWAPKLPQGLQLELQLEPKGFNNQSPGSMLLSLEAPTCSQQRHRSVPGY